jgi:aspartate aminotransferase
MSTPLSAGIGPAAPDPIFGAGDAARRDPRPDKLDLVVGLYVDPSGEVPVMAAVREAESRLAAAGGSKRYLPIGGSPAFTGPMGELLFGAPLPTRVELLGTPGGTGALRAAMELVAGIRPAASLLVAEPTWPNHHAVAAAAGLPVRTLAHLDTQGAFDLPGHLAAIATARPGDAVLLHASCHNPTGIDPAPAEWVQLAAAIAERRLVAILDLAYQGLGTGLAGDAAALGAFLDAGGEFLVAASSSKNLGLYAERVGALVIAGADASSTAVIAGHARARIRAAWSNPPAHGEAIVATVLADVGLRAAWSAELDGMRERIAVHRAALAAACAAAGIDASAIETGHGMFALLGLDGAAREALARDHAIHTAPGGRINLAALSPADAPRVAAALVAVRG